MIIKDVTTAVFIGSFSIFTSAGIIKKPPPAPIKPVTIPTKAPCIKIKGLLTKNI